MRKLHGKTSMFLAASLLLAGYTAAQTPSSTPPAGSTAPASGSGATAKSQTSSGTSGASAGTNSGTPGTKSSTTPKPGTAAKTPFTLKTDKDKQSYAIGLNIGKTMHKDGVVVNTAVLARGIRDAMAGGKVLMTDDEIKATLTALSVELKKKATEKSEAEATTNKAAGETFLAANKAKDGVVTLPSGLQYKIIKQGDGPKPTATDSVVCNYRGTLLDGTEFDSSYKRGQPATFPVGQVIKGWTEALQLMPVGSKWQLFVPADLAYGARGAGQQIEPNSTLVFEVELLSIQPKAEAKPAPDAKAPPAPDGKPAPDAKAAPTTTAPATPPPTASKPQH
jgi:FKBP-type peptidyl-prolyl cis-trans isomerase FklB